MIRFFYILCIFSIVFHSFTLVLGKDYEYNIFRITFICIYLLGLFILRLIPESTKKYFLLSILYVPYLIIASYWTYLNLTR